MQTIGIKELQTNPALLTRSLEADEYTMITKRNKPIGMAFSFDNKHYQGIKNSVDIIIPLYTTKHPCPLSQ